MLSFLCNGEKAAWLGPVREVARRHDRPFFITEGVKEVDEAVAKIGHNGSNMVAILGGDGTAQRFITAAIRQKIDLPAIALLGGGTMEQLRRWLGLRGSPIWMAQEVAEKEWEMCLQTREVQTLKIEHAGTTRYGFMFLVGPIVRLLDKYDRAGRGFQQALTTAGCTITSALTGLPRSHRSLLYPAKVDIKIEGNEAGYNRVTGLITATFSRAIFGFRPFRPRGDDPGSGRFFSMITDRPPTYIVPRLPLYYWGLISGDGHLLNYPRESMVVRTFGERRFTADGELFSITPGESIKITIGPTVKLVVL